MPAPTCQFRDAGETCGVAIRIIPKFFPQLRLASRYMMTAAAERGISGHAQRGNLLKPEDKRHARGRDAQSETRRR